MSVLLSRESDRSLAQLWSPHPLVGNREYQGLSRRPVFVGGRLTFDTIRMMTRHQRTVDRASISAVAEWGHAVIPQDPPARQRLAQVYKDWAVRRRQTLERQRAAPQ